MSSAWLPWERHRHVLLTTSSRSDLCVSICFEFIATDSNPSYCATLIYVKCIRYNISPTCFNTYIYLGSYDNISLFHTGGANGLICLHRQEGGCLASHRRGLRRSLVHLSRVSAASRRR